MTHSYSAAGNYTVTLTVFDANNATVSSSHIVTIGAATLTACFTENVTTAPTGASISFNASCSSSSGFITSYSWDFGDSGTGTGVTVSHAYSAVGNYTVTLTVTDSNSLTKTATSTKIITKATGKDVLTDGNFCSLPGNQFKLMFVQDKSGLFTLVASNPGQFYDNVFDNGTAGAPVTIHIQIPYPFVTQGSYPIQVSSSFTLSNSGCFQPAFDQTKNFAISTSGGHLSSSGHPSILIGDYGTMPIVGTTTTTITLTGTVPSTGLVYVTVQLDYGLKGTTGWSMGSTPFPATNNALPGLASSWLVTINNPQSYSFSFSDGVAGSTSPTSVNVFKINQGFAGAVTNLREQPTNGVTVKVYDNNGNLVAITTTDKNGLYAVALKYTGSKVNYQVRAILSANLYQAASVQMQANKVVVANFVIGLKGDANNDCSINILDVTLVSANYAGTKYNPIADLNGDGVIDIQDLTTVAQNFGQHC